MMNEILQWAAIGLTWLCLSAHIKLHRMGRR